MSCRTRSSASSRGRTFCTAACAGSSPSASAAPTTSRTAAEISRTGKKMYRQKGTGSARHGPGQGQSVPRRRTVVRADPAQPRDRSAEEGARARPQACLVRQGQGWRHHRARQGDRAGRQDQRAAEELHQARAQERAHHRWCRGRRRISRWPRATFRNIDVLPVQGINVYDIMRRQMLVLTKSALEALEARFK